MTFAQAPANGAEATTVPVSLPGGLAYDSAGNLYIAATNDHVIREVVANTGIINTVAGTGVQGFAGDGSAATAALLDSPVGVALDSANNLYIADSHNNRIREVIAATGIINTIAGTGVAGYGGDTGPALSALLSYPTALAIDSNGSIYIADTNNHRIRKITGTTITTVAGDGEQIFSGDGGAATAAGLDSPNGIGVDANFNLYIGDTHNQRVREVTFSSTIISTIAGTGVKSYGGDAGAASGGVLARPRGVSVESNGTILIADSDNDRIRAISGGSINTVAGNGNQGYGGDTAAATSVTIDTPRAVNSSGASIVFSDTSDFRVRQVNGSGIITTIAGIAPSGTESLTLTGTATSVAYSTGSLLAIFAFNSNTATGNITFFDVTGPTPVQIGAAVGLSSNAATLSTSTLSVGTHGIEAVYPGDANNAPTTSGVFVLGVTPATLTVTAANASRVYGTANPAFTANYAGQQGTDSFTATASSTAMAATPVGAVAIVPAVTANPGSSLTNYTVVLVNGTLTITQATAAVTLMQTVPSTTGVGTGVSTTFTAVVTDATSGSSGTPTGNVQFFDGATLLGTGTLAGGVTTFTTIFTTTGTHIISAVYQGDVNFASGATNTFNEAVGTPGYTVVANPSTLTIQRGNTGTSILTFTPVNNYQGSVTMSCSGLPVFASCAFAPSTIVFTGNNAVQTSQLTVYTLNAHDAPAGGSKQGLLWLPAGMLACLVMVRRRKMVRGLRVLMMLALAALALTAMTGCGSSAGFVTPTGANTVTVTASAIGTGGSANVNQTATITIIITP
jgi:hypothetical protein